MHCVNSIDTTAAWKKLRFILSVRFDFHMIESLSIAVHAFVSRVLMSFSVGGTRPYERGTRVGLLIELANHYTTRGALCVGGCDFVYDDLFFF